MFIKAVHLRDAVNLPSGVRQKVLQGDGIAIRWDNAHRGILITQAVKKGEETEDVVKFVPWPSIRELDVDPEREGDGRARKPKG